MAVMGEGRGHLLIRFLLTVNNKNMFERLGITHEGKADWNGITIYVVGTLALVGLIVYGTDFYTYAMYGV